MSKSVAEKIVFEVQWSNRKANTGLQFPQKTSSLETGKTFDGKDISALLHAPEVTVKLSLQKLFRTG